MACCNFGFRGFRSQGRPKGSRWELLHGEPTAAVWRSARSEARLPAEPVREHVRQLMAGGMTVLGIAEKAGVSKTGVKILLYGRSGARKGELPREIEESKAQRILALQPASAALAISA